MMIAAFYMYDLVLDESFLKCVRQTSSLCGHTCLERCEAWTRKAIELYPRARQPKRLLRAGLSLKTVSCKWLGKDNVILT